MYTGRKEYLMATKAIRKVKRDSDRSEKSKAISIERRIIRSSYAKNGGRF